MLDQDREINDLIMNEVGLEVGQNNRIYDQDTGVELMLDGSYIVAPGAYCNRSSIEFDPYNNRRLMNFLFSYFTDKNANETGVSVVSYYNIAGGKDGRIACKMSDNSTVTSNPYLRDALKYTDLIMRFNGDGNPDLKKYDGFSTPRTIRRKKGVKS